MSAADSIKKIRLEMCLEQAEFGKLIGKSAASISHYERGSRKPRLPVIREMVALARKHKIKITFEDFLT